jgi:hypothetical protein
VDWIGLAKDRNRWRAVVNSVLNLRVPRNAGKLSSGLTSSGQSSRPNWGRILSSPQRPQTAPWGPPTLKVSGYLELSPRR